jgi:hypothetical protein
VSSCAAGGAGLAVGVQGVLGVVHCSPVMRSARPAAGGPGLRRTLAQRQRDGESGIGRGRDADYAAIGIAAEFTGRPYLIIRKVPEAESAGNRIDPERTTLPDPAHQRASVA